MGMSTHISGYRPEDEKFLQMKSVYNACKSAKISIPDEVYSFFNGEDPNKISGVEVVLPKNSIREINTDSCNCQEIDLTKIPKDVVFLRVCNCY
jgi:hypothetical protein